MTIWGPDPVSWSYRCLLSDVPEFLAVPLKLGFLRKVVQPTSFSVTHSHRNDTEMPIFIVSHDCIWSPRQALGDGFSHPSHSDVQHGCILSHFSIHGAGRAMTGDGERDCNSSVSLENMLSTVLWTSRSKQESVTSWHHFWALPGYPKSICGFGRHSVRVNSLLEHGVISTCWWIQLIYLNSILTRR